MIRSEDDGAHTVVEVQECIRSHKVFSEIIRKRVAPVWSRLNLQQ